MTPENLRLLISNHSDDLHVNKSSIDPTALLCAIAWMETSFGQRTYATLHEPAYCYGGRYYKMSQDLRTASIKWGCQAHCSYGPFQLLYATAYDFGYRDDPILLREPQHCIDLVIRILNRRVADKLTDEKPEDFFDAWNSGNPRDHIIPADYITKALIWYSKEKA